MFISVNPLHAAVKGGHIAAVQVLLAAPNCDPEAGAGPEEEAGTTHTLYIVHYCLTSHYRLSPYRPLSLCLNFVP
jgi:hypothetical protein